MTELFGKLSKDSKQETSFYIIIIVYTILLVGLTMFVVRCTTDQNIGSASNPEELAPDYMGSLN